MKRIKYIVMWGGDEYDSFWFEDDARHVIDKYSHRYPDSEFKLLKRTCTEVELEI